MGYLSYPYEDLVLGTTAAEHPRKTLFDFARSAVAEDGAERVSLQLLAEVLSVVTEDGARWLRPVEFLIGEEDGAVLLTGACGCIGTAIFYDWPPL